MKTYICFLQLYNRNTERAKYRIIITVIINCCHPPPTGTAISLSRGPCFHWQTQASQLSSVKEDLLDLRMLQPKLNNLSTATKEGMGVIQKSTPCAAGWTGPQRGGPKIIPFLNVNYCENTSTERNMSSRPGELM